MELKPGYKLTEVGVIPEEWEVKTIEELAHVTSGKRLPLGFSLVGNPTPHPYVRVTDMRPGTVSLSAIKFVPEDVFPFIRRYRIYESDLFISVAGSLGIVGKIPKELDGANLTENANRITNIVCSRDYLLYVLMSPLIQNVIDAIRTVGAQPKLALTRIRKFAVPLPPSEAEQRAIAEALRDVDALLDGLDRLIAKKRDIKQTAMQQLLTGRTRLPGFHGEWEVKPFDEIFIRINAKANQIFVTDYQHTGAYPVVDQGQIPIVGFSDRADKRLKCPMGGVIVFGDHTCVVKYIAFDFLVGADGTQLFHGRVGVSTQFYAFQLEYRGIEQTGYNRHFKFLKERKFLVPPVGEQTAIAAVLSDMDAELAALEARREKTRALKQAMMHELLTGRTRLVDAPASAT